MLGSSELVELVVVALAEVEEARPSIEMLAVLRFVDVFRVVLHVGEALGDAALVENGRVIGVAGVQDGRCGRLGAFGR